MNNEIFISGPFDNDSDVYIIKQFSYSICSILAFTTLGDFPLYRCMPINIPVEVTKTREATDEEKKWLLICISEGELVPRTEAIEQYDILTEKGFYKEFEDKMGISMEDLETLQDE